MTREVQTETSPAVAGQEERLREVVSQLGGLAAEMELYDHLGEYDEESRDRLGAFVLSISEQVASLRSTIGLAEAEHDTLSDTPIIPTSHNGNGSQEAGAETIEDATVIAETDQGEERTSEAAEEPQTLDQEEGGESPALDGEYDLSGFTSREIVVIEYLLENKGKEFAPRELHPLIDASSQAGQKQAFSSLIRKLRAHPELAQLLQESGNRTSKRYWLAEADNLEGRETDISEPEHDDSDLHRVTDWGLEVSTAKGVSLSVGGELVKMRPTGIVTVVTLIKNGATSFEDLLVQVNEVLGKSIDEKYLMGVLEEIENFFNEYGHPENWHDNTVRSNDGLTRLLAIKDLTKEARGRDFLGAKQ